MIKIVLEPARNGVIKKSLMIIMVEEENILPQLMFMNQMKMIRINTVM